MTTRGRQIIEVVLQFDKEVYNRQFKLTSDMVMPDEYDFNYISL